MKQNKIETNSVNFAGTGRSRNDPLVVVCADGVIGGTCSAGTALCSIEEWG